MSCDSAADVGAGVERPLAGLTALAALLQCADAEAWTSLARPHAAGLSVIVFNLTGELQAALGL
jgi:hypothetical protein